MRTIIACAAALTIAATAGASGQFVNGTGYIDAHLAQFRAHVNNVRAHKCLARFTIYLSPAELDALPVLRRGELRRGWKHRHLRAHSASSRCTPWYVTAQIRAANALGRESLGDPWPNCPDPWDGSGASWWPDTVRCENTSYFQLYGYPRAFLDSPGFYRCGLQFDPSWERRFGRLCP